MKQSISDIEILQAIAIAFNISLDEALTLITLMDVSKANTNIKRVKYNQSASDEINQTMRAI